MTRKRVITKIKEDTITDKDKAKDLDAVNLIKENEMVQ